MNEIKKRAQSGGMTCQSTLRRSFLSDTSSKIGSVGVEGADDSVVLKVAEDFSWSDILAVCLHESENKIDWR